AAVTRLTKGALRRLPDDPARLGDILHGLGEIAARSHVSIMEPLIAYLGRRRRLRLDTLFAAAFAREANTRLPVRLDAVAFTQWLSSATTDWNTLTLALSHVEHGNRFMGGGRYGLAFTARIVLVLDARAVDACIRANPNRQHLAAIGNAALATVFPFDGKARPAALLRSRNAAIRSIGAAALISPLEIIGAPLGFRDCRAILVAGGVAPSDATWMMGLRIKDAIHQRYRLEDGLKNESARPRYVEKNPQAAMGGAHNADAELRMLHRRLDTYTKRYSGLLPELESMLSDIAADWPDDGLSDEQIHWLDNIFVDTAEFRHRLAEKLAHRSNREWLLKRNIGRLRDFVGLAATPTEVPRNHFFADERRFQPLAEWTAKSLHLLYEADKHGVGKRTSFLVSGVAQASTALIAEPFIAARKPEAWQSVMTRAAFADRFALMVAATMPEAKRHTVTTLNALALEHAFAILSYGQVPAQASETFFRLTTLAVHNMRYDSSPDDLRQAWSLAELLPDFARALALWSSPTLVTKHKALASDLFCRVGALPLPQGGQDLQMSQMLSLLDMAVSSCAAAGRADLITHVISLWRTAYKDWHAINDTWAESAAMLAGAVTADGPGRAQLRAGPTFAGSYCALLIASSNDAAISL
ncbi:MAG: hypothetical protein WCB44_15815, partial [Stellaceae bacterium]